MSVSPRRRRPLAPLDLDEIAQDPGFRGMLSFLEVSPEAKAREMELREKAEPKLPTGHLPMGSSLYPDVKPPDSELPVGTLPVDHLPMGDSPAGDLPVGNSILEDVRGLSGAFVDLTGGRRRRLRYCRTVQDGHTSGEQLAYQALWTYARRHGRTEDDAYVFDLSLARLCELLGIDHKGVKRLVSALVRKLAIEILRQPDYKLSLPTRYRIFNFTEILNRRRAAGMLWVVRTRGAEFVDPATAQDLLAQSPMGESPMGISQFESQAPMGEMPEVPMGDRPEVPMGDRPTPILIKEIALGKTTSNTTSFPAALARSLSAWIVVDDDAVLKIWEACRTGTPDCTEEEVAAFCRLKQPLIIAGASSNPPGLLITSVPKYFENGGGTPLLEYRKEQENKRQRESQRLRHTAEAILRDSETSSEDRAWAENILQGR